MSMTPNVGSALEAKVRDFFRAHAAQDADKVHIVLSLGLPANETMSMLAGKYGVSHAVVQSRAALIDKLLEQFGGSEDGPELVFQLLETVGLAATYDVPMLLRRLTQSSPRRVASYRGDSATRVELSPSQPSRSTWADDGVRRAPSQLNPVASAAAPSPFPRLPVEFDASAALEDAHNQAHEVSATASSHLGVRPPALEDGSLRSFHTQLVTLEAALFQRCMEVELASQQVAAHEASHKQQAASLGEREAALRRGEQDFAQRTASREVQLAEQTARVHSELQHLEETRRKVAEQQRAVEASQRDVADRESKIAAALQSIASREAAAASQLKLAEQERALCQKLSAEVLKRETAVRSVEKTLAAAKTELVRLEDELNTRAKQLVDDEGATRRWASELEKRDLTMQSIFEQLRHKGIHVSY